MDPEAIAAFNEAEAINPAVNSTFHRSRDALRAARKAGATPEAEVVRLEKAVRRLGGELAEASKLRPVDREECDDVLSQGSALAAVLRRLAPVRVRQVRSRAERLVSVATRGVLSSGDLEDAVLLAILAQSEGAEYWNLVRGVRGALRAEGRRPVELWCVVRFLAPDDVFGDGPSYPGAPRGASRATRVIGVTSAGLPGLGKKG